MKSLPHVAAAAALSAFVSGALRGDGIGPVR
jgi:hypothetical protein